MEIAPAMPVVQVVVRPVQVSRPVVQERQALVRLLALRTVEPQAPRPVLAVAQPERVRGRVPLAPGLPVLAALPQVRPGLMAKARRLVTERAWPATGRPTGARRWPVATPSAWPSCSGTPLPRLSTMRAALLPSGSPRAT
jgi:hypothetical protein